MAASSRSNKSAENPEANQAAAEAPEDRKERVAEAKEREDVVAVESIDRNGKPDQSADYKVLGKDVPIEGV